jgi:pimeloyl-ACP methyl ester carboxylesterase
MPPSGLAEKQDLPDCAVDHQARIGLSGSRGYRRRLPAQGRRIAADAAGDPLRRLQGHAGKLLHPGIVQPERRAGDTERRCHLVLVMWMGTPPPDRRAEDRYRCVATDLPGFGLSRARPGYQFTPRRACPGRRGIRPPA